MVQDSSIHVPDANSKIYKDECMFCYHTPESVGGLFVSLHSFYGFCPSHLQLDQRSSQEGVFYVNCQRVRRAIVPPSGDGEGVISNEPQQKITKLAINVDGGFQSGPQYEFEDTWTFVRFPDLDAKLALTSDLIPEAAKLSAIAITKAISITQIQELESLNSVWDGTARIETTVKDLHQNPNAPKIPSSGWKCEADGCDLKQNLWLNLTTGKIFCGRQYHDGTGGRGHALQHHVSGDGGPLAVKLGTITAQGADVYSYSEDEMVLDPKLATHLQHFGIDLAKMEKTEKTMSELELDLNLQKEWSAITESGSNLVPVYGPGYTGIINLGSTCYMSSVLQSLLVVPSFYNFFVKNASNIFGQCSGNPADDVTIQFAKVLHGLASGDYSRDPDEGKGKLVQNGIRPSSFWALIGRGHPEFSTKRQQDSSEYFIHLLDKLDRQNYGDQNPGDIFRFEFEDRVECGVSHTVKYIRYENNMLSLPLASYLMANSEDKVKLNLEECIQRFVSSSEIDDFESPLTREKTTALKATKFRSFPEYLLIHLQKFYLTPDWQPKKMDVEMEVPDVLNLEAFRGRGLVAGETEMPAENQPLVNSTYVGQLKDMGFPEGRAKKAVIATKNVSAEAAFEWLLANEGQEEPEVNVNAPAIIEPIDDAKVAELNALGFSVAQARHALKERHGNLEGAAEYLFTHGDDFMDVGDDAVAAAVVATASGSQGQQANTPPRKYSDGVGAYELVGFVSHMGSSTHCGHYVCHLLKEGRWVIFNDEKVAISEHPPKGLAYMYLYKRKV